MVNSPMDREESIDYATYLVLKEALTKGFVEMSLLGKFSRIPGFDKSAIGMMKGQIKDIAESAISNPVESKKQLELMETQLDMKRIESLYLPADIKDYVEMVVHAKIYRAFKEGIETDKGFIWKRILIPILEQRSDEIYGKRQVILNGFLDAPIGIYEKIYNKYVPLNPDKIEMLEKKLDDYGIPINFPHTPDDLMNVDIQTGIIEDTKDRVVVRFAPTPNGPLSIGHSRGVCLLGEYEKRYPGAKLLLRFDDTDPAKSTDLSEYGIPDVFQQIIDEMEWLLDIDIPKRNIIIASERFGLYQNEVIEAMRKGKAVCDTRRDGLVSGVDNNLSVFASMLKGEYAAGEAAVKLTASIPKGDLSKDYDNRAGEILFRMVEYNGENLCVPLMNLQSVVDDKKTGVTHIVRGADHDGGNLGRQKKIWSEMGYGQFPFVDNWGLVALTDDQEYNTYITSKEFDDKHDRIDTTLAEKAGKMGILTTRISTSRMRKGMNEGLYSENQFQSPELPTLTSLKHEHLYMENSKPITSEAIRAYWNIVRHNQDVTAIFNREELRQLNERMSKGGYVFEEKAYADEQERRDYIKGLKMQDRYYAEEDEETFDAEIMSSVEIENHSVDKYKNKHFLTDKELSDFLIKHGTNHGNSFRKNRKAKGNIIISTPEGGWISEANFAISKPDNWNDKDMLMIIPDDILGIYQDDFDAEDKENKPSKISGLMLANTHWIPMYKKTKKEGESFDAWYERFMFRKSAESFNAEKTPFVWCVVRSFDADDGSGFDDDEMVEMTSVLGVFKYKKDADKAMKSIYNKMKSQGLEEDYSNEGFYTDNGYIKTTKSKLGQLWMPYGAYRFWNAENWGGDPEGPLAKALEKARKNAKKPKKPLKIERLDAESFEAPKKNLYRDYPEWLTVKERENFHKVRNNIGSLMDRIEESDLYKVKTYEEAKKWLEDYWLETLTDRAYLASVLRNTGRDESGKHGKYILFYEPPYARVIWKHAKAWNNQSLDAESFELSHDEKATMIYEDIQQNLNNPEAVKVYYKLFWGEEPPKNYEGDMALDLIEAVEQNLNGKAFVNYMYNEMFGAESFAAEGRCPITGEPVARGKTYADGEVAKMANQTIKLFGGKRGGFRRSDVMKAVMALNDYGGELSATGWAERVNSNPKYRTTRELNASNVHRVLAFLKPDVYERKYTGYSMKAKYVYSIVKGDKLLDWLKPEFIPEEFKKK